MCNRSLIKTVLDWKLSHIEGRYLPFTIDLRNVFLHFTDNFIDTEKKLTSFGGKWISYKEK